MKQLAQALLDEYPNQEIVIFFNPYFVDGLMMALSKSARLLMLILSLMPFLK